MCRRCLQTQIRHLLTEGKWKWAIGQKLAENNSQQHMAGHLKPEIFSFLENFPGNPRRVLNTPLTLLTQAPSRGKGTFCSSSFAQSAAGRGKTHSCWGVCSDLVGPSERLLLCYISGTAVLKMTALLEILCGLKTAKCASVCVTLCLSQQRCPCGVWEAQTPPQEADLVFMCRKQCELYDLPLEQLS